jgi:1-acyl-sn-glycerol-3-phosphate acyltransferase
MAATIEQRPVPSPATPLQRVARRLLAPPTRRAWPVELSGTEHIPTHGGAILCPNHRSFFDSVFLALLLERPVYFIGKAEYLDSWTTRRLFPAMGMIPIERDNGAKAMVTLASAASIVERGALLCIYPEGTRSRDGLLHRGHTGAARLAAAVGCPIVPVGIVGTAEIQPPDVAMPRLGGRCTISFGAPIDAPEPDRRSVRTATDEVMARVAALSGQEYVATYSRRPSTAATEHARRGHAVDLGIAAAPA